ncbi:MAG: hypothetical protein K0B87_04805 [Candidatus Syntrophosphaera sp.]|nr:hypothetical protein [Candidatus Syntrophosphaera sp.]
MKLNSLLSAVIFSLFGTGLVAQYNNLDFSFSANRSVRNVENNLQYQMSPLRSSLLKVRGLTYREERLSFSQENQISALELDLALDRKMLRHSFQSGYQYLFDYSDLEESFQPYRSKTGFLGYTLGFLPTDSLLIEAGVKGYLRSEEDRYLLGNIMSSDGHQLFGRASAGAGFGGVRAGLGAEIDRKKMDWEYYQSASLNAYLHHQSDYLAFNNNFNLSQRRDDLFVLGPDRTVPDRIRGLYKLYDRQKRRSLLYSGFLGYSPSESFQVTLQEVFTQRVIELEENVVRNNADQVNQASLAFSLAPWSKLGWNTVLKHSYAIKEFSNAQNTRHTENRNLGTNLAWEYIFGDTLSAGVSVDLQITSFPDDNNRWDNDLRNIRFNLGNVHYWRDRLKLRNAIFWNLTDDVYINEILSNNNKHTNSLIYNPECAILIGDRLLFNQSYLIRADYTDYVYDEADKALYRQLSLEYKLVFDSFPFIARSQDQRWLLLPYRNKGTSALLTDLTFGFERNEYADYSGSFYTINFKNTRYTAAFTLKHDIQDVYYVLKPQYSWGTWKEYNLMCGFAWKFTDFSLLEFSLNPVGESLNELDWRTSVSLSAHF